MIPELNGGTRGAFSKEDEHSSSGISRSIIARPFFDHRDDGVVKLTVGIASSYVVSPAVYAYFSMREWRRRVCPDELELLFTTPDGFGKLRPMRCRDRMGWSL
mmetsp:Transcript_59006/g.70373  ORF Transcript_59006/g.70373 Transcript_59006/m.70373 type:complete len:103 (-) Transcript_59006:17-325(-)